MSHVDLHLHLLPGVDDGPRDLHASLEHADRMAREGVHDAVVTPHVGHPGFHLDVATIPARTGALQAALDAAGIPLRLRPGGELHPRAVRQLRPDELATVAQGPPGARWVLAEVPFAGIDGDFLAGCAAIRAQGLGLVIAHPERAAGFLEDGRGRLEGELLAGAVLQVNACSLLGRHGDEARIGAEGLLRDRLAYVLASDGHGGSRAHTLHAGFRAAVAAGTSEVEARRLTCDNPRLLLRHGLTPGSTGGAVLPTNGGCSSVRSSSSASSR